MKRLRFLPVGVVCALWAATVASAAETGDFDGDGRITVGDVILAFEHLWDDASAFADLSFDAFKDYPCYEEPTEGFVDVTQQLL